MSCGVVDHAYLAQLLIDLFNLLRATVNHDGFFIALLAFLMIGVTLLFEWTQRLIVPIIANYIRETFWPRAREWFEKRGLAFSGFKIMTCYVSLILGSLLYALLRVAIRFPAHWGYTLSVVLTTILLFSFAGYLASGRIRLKPFLTYFYIPTFTAVGLFVLNFTIDVAISVSAAIATLLNAA